MKADAKRQAEDARRLRAFTEFDGFSDDDLLRIAGAATHASTSGPWPLIHQHTPSDACYILLSGEAGVYVGRDRIAVVGQGEVIGESALCRGKLRNATVTTTGPAELLRIGRDDLARLLDEYLHCVKPWTRLWRDVFRQQHSIRVSTKRDWARTRITAPTNRAPSPPGHRARVADCGTADAGPYSDLLCVRRTVSRLCPSSCAP